MADKEKLQEIKGKYDVLAEKAGGPKMLRQGLGQQAKRKKSLEEIQKEMRKKNLGVEFKKILRKADEKLSKVDKGFMKDPKNQGKIIESVIQNQPFKPAKISAASRREGASVFNKMAKGGRAGYRMGGKCKLAKKGKGRAYGKNS